MAVQKINWSQFRIKNEYHTKAFEELCYYLFCREFNRVEGIRTDFNEVGLETKPVFYNKKYYGFQAKFFEHKNDGDQIKKSVKKAIKHFGGDLNVIYIYLNHPIGSHARYDKEIEKIAKKAKIDIEWIVPSNLEVILNQPSNLDLAQLYFGIGDEFGFIKNASDHKIQTFLSSKEYIELPISHKLLPIPKPVDSILKNANKTFLLVGHPGSGKSYLIHNFFRYLGGLDKRTTIQMMGVLEKNQSVPMMVNLKNCAIENIESILRERQKDGNIRGKKMGFVYLFDGLDELNEERADHVLSYIRDLEQQKETIKIIISCRSGNLNRLKAIVYFPGVVEYKIQDLSDKHLSAFFTARNDNTKRRALVRLQKENPSLLFEIKDILLIRLLWDTIEQLDSYSIVTDLLEKKISLLLNDPEHRKNIDQLNLLEAKSEEIMLLNQDISFRLQKKFQFRFELKELQNVILERFPRLDYKSINDLINYLSSIFFENDYPNDRPVHPRPSFIYQHRRYQEFFFAQKLKDEYERNPKILREVDILSGRDFFETFFLPYIRKIYERNKDVVGLLDINLLDIYLGRHRGYGVTDAYYLNSAEFIPAIVAQNAYVLEELLEDEQLQIKKLLFVKIPELKKYFDEWKKDKNDYRVNEYLLSIWSNGISSSIGNIVLFWKVGKEEIAKQLIANINEAEKLYTDNRYIESLDKDRKPDNPHWSRWQDYLFILIHIKKRTPQDLLGNLIRSNYENFTEENNRYATDEQGKDKLVRSFFRVILTDNGNKLTEIIDDLDDFELLSLLAVLASIQYLPALLQNSEAQTKLKTLLEKRNLPTNDSGYFLPFFKTLLGLSLSPEEASFVEEDIAKLRKERSIDWHFRNTSIRFALMSYAQRVNNFNFIAKDDAGDQLRYYDELALYSALFAEFISIKQGKSTLKQIVRDYIAYINDHDDRLGLYLKFEISSLWANIISLSSSTPENLFHLKERLLQEDTNIVAFSFFYKLNEVNKKLFDKLINESELKSFEEALPKSDDYQSYVNDCFSLASFFANLNKEKAKFYIVKGIKDGMLRHGWRKDTLVSYDLVDALEVLWKNNWETREKLIEYTREVFNLTQRVLEFTDGDGTARGPYNVLELASKYDIALAEEFKDKLILKTRHASNVNSAITSVLLGRIDLGISIEEVEREIKKYLTEYGYERKKEADSFEQKILVYAAISHSDMYTDQERKAAFDKVFELIEEIKKEGIDYYLRDVDFKDFKDEYILLCKKYNKTPNVSYDKEESQPIRQTQSEDKFLETVRSADTKSKIIELYKKIEKYENGIVLTKHESWKELLNKTFNVMGSINLFLKLLEHFSFPHTDFFTANSKYFHIGLAIALSDLRMKSEAIKHLYKDTGHGGFTNMMKVYDLIGDKEMGRRLFARYLQLCDFLCN